MAVADQVERFVRTNRIPILAGGGIVVALLAAQRFRPDLGGDGETLDSSPVPAPLPPAGMTPEQNLAAFSAGAAAAASGFTPGAGLGAVGFQSGAILGAGALDFASVVAAGQAAVTQTLAESQAAVAGESTQALADALAEYLQNIPPIGFPIPAPTSPNTGIVPPVMPPPPPPTTTPPPPTTTPSGPPASHIHVARCDGVAIRTNPGVTRPTITKVNRGATIYAAAIVTGGSWSAPCGGSGNRWWHIYALNGQPLDAYTYTGGWS